MSIAAISFVVPGEPLATARPRVTRNGTFTPKRSLEAQGRVLAAWGRATGAVNWEMNPDRQYGVRIIFHRGTFRRADLDNLAKTVLDGLNGHAFPDDSQVTRLQVEEGWGPRLGIGTAETLVSVRRLPLDMQDSALPLDP